LSGENAIFARCYVKSESRTLYSKHRFQSQTCTFLLWKPKPTFSTESADCCLLKEMANLNTTLTVRMVVVMTALQGIAGSLLFAALRFFK